MIDSPAKDHIEQLQADGALGAELIGECDGDSDRGVVPRQRGDDLGLVLRQTEREIEDHPVERSDFADELFLLVHQLEAEALVVDLRAIGDVVLKDGRVGTVSQPDEIGDDGYLVACRSRFVGNVLRAGVRLGHGSPAFPSGSALGLRSRLRWCGSPIEAHGSHLLGRGLRLLLWRWWLWLLLWGWRLLLWGSYGGGSPPPTADNLLLGRSGLRLRFSGAPGFRGTCSSGASPSSTSPSGACRHGLKVALEGTLKRRLRDSEQFDGSTASEVAWGV